MLTTKTRIYLAYDSVRDYIQNLIAAATGQANGRPTVDSILSDLEITADALGDVATGCMDEVAANDLLIEQLEEENDDLTEEAARAARIEGRLKELFS